MTLEQILTIEAIVSQGSFKAAADYLHKSQPSISMAIKKLEEEYQIILFKRDEYRPSLTDEGKIFYEKSLGLLKEFRELESLAKQMNKGIEVKIRVSIDAVSPVSLVLKFLKNFFAKHPTTQLELRFEVLSGTIERLIDGEVDLAITPKPHIDYPLDYKLMTSAKMVSVASQSLVATTKKVTDQFLRNYNQIILADSARRLSKISTGILPGGKSITVTDIYFKKELILQGLGWGGLPYDLIKSEINAKKLVPIKTTLIKDRDIDIYLVRDTTKPMGPVMKELWRQLAEEGFE